MAEQNPTDPVRARRFADAMDPQRNAFAFLRWVLALAVLFSHSGPLGGFFGGHDIGWIASGRQTALGTIAVFGFFMISGYLVTGSRLRAPSGLSYLWNRFLRIYPGFWVSLIVVAFVIAPIAWRFEHGELAGYFSYPTTGPWDFLTSNWTLRMNQYDIAGLGVDTPYGAGEAVVWNGSLWTLIYEVECYLIVAVLGMLGILRKGWVLISLNVIFYAIAAWSTMRDGLPELLSDLVVRPMNPRLISAFLLGALLALYGERLIMDLRIAVGALAVAGTTFFVGGWQLFGVPALLYLIMYAAVRIPIHRWDKYGDLSYGIYVYAFPLQVLFAIWGWHQQGWWVYVGATVLVVHVLAFISWHVVEKPALKLKRLARPRYPRVRA